MQRRKAETAESSSSGSRAMWRTIATIGAPILFVTLALWLLRHELRDYRLHDILAEMSTISTGRLVLAALTTLVAYLVLSGYDWLGFQYIRHPLPLHRITSAAFISYAMSYNLGHTLITGGSIRYRLYSAWGLSTEDIAKVVVFCVLTFWLGVLVISGAAFLREPATISFVLYLPPVTVRPLGVVLLGVVAVYLAWTATRKEPIHVRSWTLEIPPVWISLGQIIVTVVDLVLAGTVLYILLPKNLGLSFPSVIGIYLISVIIGLSSQVPGGLGVFETAFLHLIPHSAPSSAVAGALLVYRGIYYLFPLALASLLLAGHEAQIRIQRAPAARAALDKWIPLVVPQVLAVITFIGGAILLLSGARPGDSSRLHSLSRILPLPVVEISHFLGSLAGTGLILLAQGIQRRLDVAYWMSVLLLTVGVAFCLLRGFDYEEAIALSVLAVALIPCRTHFYRKAAFLSEPFTPGWLAAVGVILICGIWLGLFSYKNVDYAHDLWWQFSLTADAPRFMRAGVGVAVVVLFVAVCRLTRYARVTPAIPSPEVLETIRPIVATSRDTLANLALVGDKALLLNEKRDAFIMYAVEGRSWVAINGPIGPKDEHADLLWRFRELVDGHAGWSVFYQIKPENLHLYLDLGLTLLKLGEEARVPLADFSLEGNAQKGLRHASAKAEREGCTFEILSAERTPGVLAELKAISDAWLADKNTREKRFSLGFFKEDYIAGCPVALVRNGGAIVTFANLWLGGEKEELSVDLMRHSPNAPPGTMDFLFVNLMLWGRTEGYRFFNLGMAPLSGLGEHALAPLWNRVGGFVFRHGEQFYNFDGLRQYKDKFNPEWTPRYLAAPGGLALPQILLNLATLIAGGPKGLVAK